MGRQESDRWRLVGRRMGPGEVLGVGGPVDVGDVEEVLELGRGGAGEDADADRADDVKGHVGGSDEVQLEGPLQLPALGHDKRQRGVVNYKAKALGGRESEGVAAEHLQMRLQEVHLADERAHQRDVRGQQQRPRQQQDRGPARVLQLRIELPIAGLQLTCRGLRRDLLVCEQLAVLRDKVPDGDPQVLKQLLRFEQLVVLRWLKRLREMDAETRQRAVAANRRAFFLEMLGSRDFVLVRNSRAFGASPVLCWRLLLWSSSAVFGIVDVVVAVFVIVVDL